MIVQSMQTFGINEGMQKLTALITIMVDVVIKGVRIIIYMNPIQLDRVQMIYVEHFRMMCVRNTVIAR